MSDGNTGIPPTSGSGDGAAPDPTSGPPSGGSDSSSKFLSLANLQKYAKWLFGTVIFGGVVIVALQWYVNDYLDEKKETEQEREANRNPLSFSVSTSDDGPEDGFFSYLVTDLTRLPDDFGPRPSSANPQDSELLIQDCERLWSIAKDAGGVPMSRTSYKVVLHGVAKATSIDALRAVVTDRSEPADGALLACAIAMGGVEPIGFNFDLTKQSPVAAMRVTSNQSEAQFEDGFIISVEKDEYVPLAINVQLPVDSIDWHLEADVSAGEVKSTLIINDNGRDFYGPGFRLDGNYEESYGAGFLPGAWERGVNFDISAPGGTPQTAVPQPTK